MLQKNESIGIAARFTLERGEIVFGAVVTAVTDARRLCSWPGREAFPAQCGTR